MLVLGTPGPGQDSLNKLLADGDASAERLGQFAPAPDDVALMLLSGGTTGLPKVIPRTHNDYVYNCRQSGDIAGFSAATVYLALLPMAHNYTLACPGVLGALAHGGTAVIAPDITFETATRLIEEERVTVVSAGVPLVINWLNSELPPRDFSSCAC